MLTSSGTLSARGFIDDPQPPAQCQNASFTQLPLNDDQSILDRYNNENRRAQKEEVILCPPPVAEVVVAPLYSAAITTQGIQLNINTTAILGAISQGIQKMVDDFLFSFLGPLFQDGDEATQDIEEGQLVEEVGTKSLINSILEFLGGDFEASNEVKNKEQDYMARMKLGLESPDELDDSCRIASQFIGAQNTINNPYGIRWAFDNMIHTITGSTTVLKGLVRRSADSTIRDLQGGEQGNLQNLEPIGGGSKFAASHYNWSNPNFTKIQIDGLVDTDSSVFSPDNDTFIEEKVSELTDPVIKIRKSLPQYRFWCHPGEEYANAGIAGICPNHGDNFLAEGVTINKPNVLFTDFNGNPLKGPRGEPIYKYDRNDVNFAATFLNPQRLSFDDSEDHGEGNEFTIAGQEIDLQQQAALDFINNVFGDPLPKLSEEKLKTKSPEVIEYLMDKRRLAGMRSVALTTFAELYGRRVPASVPDGSEPFILKYIDEVFPDSEDDEIRFNEIFKESIGDKPSKEALLEVLTRAKFLNPTHFAIGGGLDPNQLNAREYEISGTETLLAYEVLQSSLRREAMMATILELQLSDDRKDLEDLNSTLTN